MYRDYNDNLKIYIDQVCVSISICSITPWYPLIRVRVHYVKSGY